LNNGGGDVVSEAEMKLFNFRGKFEMIQTHALCYAGKTELLTFYVQNILGIQYA